MVHFLPIDTEFGCANTDLFYDPSKIANGLSTRDHWPFCSEIFENIFCSTKTFSEVFGIIILTWKVTKV